MSELIYNPYKGGGGPTIEQVEHNTNVLKHELDKQNIPSELDREWAKLMWGGNELNLEITRPKDLQTIFVGYDRWGYVADGPMNHGIVVEQGDLSQTLEAIYKWYYE